MTRYGFGMEYTPSLIIMGSEQPTPSVYFPILLKNYLIEPILSFQSDVDDDNMAGTKIVESEKLIAGGVGLYETVTFSSVRSYTGIKILYGRNIDKTEYELTSPYSSLNSEIYTSIFVFSPTIGGEYLIGAHITFGGELEIMYS